MMYMYIDGSQPLYAHRICTFAGGFHFVFESDVSRLLFYAYVTSSYMKSKIQCKYAQKDQCVIERRWLVGSV